MKAKTTDHVVMRNKDIFCSHCGRIQQIPFPIEIPVFVAMGKAFTKTHKNCAKTWVQPEVDQSLPLHAKRQFWLDHGERGMSSEAMFQCLSGQNLNSYKTSHPHDPSDFRRCYLLLKTIPEWEPHLERLKNLSIVWEKIVDNWQKLSDMLEEKMKTEKDNGMYDFMKTLGC